MSVSNSDSDGPPTIPEEGTSFELTDIAARRCTALPSPAYPPGRESHGRLKRQTRVVPLQHSEKLTLRKQSLLPDDVVPSPASQGQNACLLQPLDENSKVLRVTPRALVFRVGCNSWATQDAQKPQQKLLVMQNVSSDSILFGLVPPASQAFSLSSDQHKTSLPAGMRHRLQVRFDPTIGAPQSDHIGVVFSCRNAERGLDCNSRTSESQKKPRRSTLFYLLVPLTIIYTFGPAANPDLSVSSLNSKRFEEVIEGQQHLEASQVASIDFGCIRAGAVAQRRVLLPFSSWRPVAFSAELKEGSQAFSVEPQKGFVGVGSPTALSVYFAPTLHATYTTELRINFSTTRIPYRLGLMGCGVPVNTSLQVCSVDEHAMSADVKSKAIRQAEAHADSTAVKSALAAKSEDERTGDVHSAEVELTSEACRNSSFPEQVPREHAVSELEISRQHKSSAAVYGGLERAAQGELYDLSCGSNYEVIHTSGRRLEINSGESCAKCRIDFDQRWADMVALLRIQNLGTHTAKGAVLPSAALMHRLQCRRSHDIRRMLKHIQHQDRARNSVMFASGPIAPSQRASNYIADDRSVTVLAQTHLKLHWMSELLTRLKLAAATAVAQARAARRLSMLRPWLRPLETSEDGSRLRTRQHEQETQGPKHDLSWHQQPRRTMQTRREIVFSVKSAKSQAFTDSGATASSRVTGEDMQSLSIGEESRLKASGTLGKDTWCPNVALPSVILPAEEAKEADAEDILSPQFWGTENLNVGDLFSCLQNDRLLTPLPQPDVEIFRLKEADFVTCTGGLEVKDNELLQSLVDATPFLIEEEHFALCSGSSSKGQLFNTHETDISIHMLTTKLGDLRLFPPESSQALAQLAWRFIAPSHPLTSGCMLMPHFVETDLPYCFLQQVAEEESCNSSKSLLPPFADILPSRGCLECTPSVSSQSLWPFGASIEDAAIRTRFTADQQGAAHCASLHTASTVAIGRVPYTESAVAISQQESLSAAGQLAQGECAARSGLMMKTNKALADIWGTSRREQLKRLRALNASLPLEFQIPNIW